MAMDCMGKLLEAPTVDDVLLAVSARDVMQSGFTTCDCQALCHLPWGGELCSVWLLVASLVCWGHRHQLPSVGMAEGLICSRLACQKCDVGSLLVLHNRPRTLVDIYIELGVCTVAAAAPSMRLNMHAQAAHGWTAACRPGLLAC